MRLLLLLLLLTAAVAWSIRTGLVELPPQHDPWSALDPEAEPNWLAGWKFRRTIADPVRCKEFLATTRLRFDAVADVEREDGCGYSNAVRIRDGEMTYGERFVMACPLAASFAMFERHSLQPAAQRIFGEPVVRIDHYGTYACRNTYGRESGRLSQHARANAFDVSGFRLEGGQRITVVNHWTEQGETQQFLHAVRDGACRWFSGVLGPDYNDAHADHFHFDRGPYRICR